jgi:hypothetical protein
VVAGTVSGCAGTHVLLPDTALLRRQDELVVIGAEVEVKVAGEGYRRIAPRLAVPTDTVRGWPRRLAERAEQIRAQFTRWAVRLDPELGWCGLPAAGWRIRRRRSDSPRGRGRCDSVLGRV